MYSTIVVTLTQNTCIIMDASNQGHWYGNLLNYYAFHPPDVRLRILERANITSYIRHRLAAASALPASSTKMSSGRDNNDDDDDDNNNNEDDDDNNNNNNANNAASSLASLFARKMPHHHRMPPGGGAEISESVVGNSNNLPEN
jgi:hypothetical protein